MATLSPFAMIHTLDQWRRVGHDNTALAQDGPHHGIVQLAWTLDERLDSDGAGEAEELPAGMAFDPWCRLYRAVPERGQVEKLLWAAKTANYRPEPVALFAPRASTDFGDFDASNGDSQLGPLQTPTALAVDRQGRLFIAERASQTVLVYDLVENTLLGRIRFEREPLALSSDGEQVWVLFADETEFYARLRGRAEPVYLPLPEGLRQPIALAVTGNGIYVIDRGNDAATDPADSTRIVPLDSIEDAFSVPYARALLFVQPDVLVVARRASEDLLRFQIQAGAHSELPHLKARHYDGRGLVLTPDGHVAYWSTSSGLLRATLARVRYETSGSVVSYQLDSGEFQTQWGRLFIDACLPRGTMVSARCVVSDELPETASSLPRTPPANAIGLTIVRPDLSPPMPPQNLVDQVTTGQAFYRRGHGNELPWQDCPDEQHFQTYEAPIIAPPGRYLWVVLELTGSARSTPKIRSLRAEYPSHNLLRRLPQVYSRELPVADFLRRYLAISEGNLRDIDVRASLRHVLLDPYATPAVLLPWLGNFLGLTVDSRWPERAKRELLANATWLFRYRGTVMGLKRFLEIYLDSQVTLIEHFKVRGLGGALLGSEDALTSNSVLGAGFRIGGQLGTEETISINEVDIDTAIRSHAHKFSVIVPLSLSAEQRAVVEHILQVHRPAHTVFDLCSVDAGMRVGLGLHTGLTTIVGSTSGFGRLQVGASVLGHSDTLGYARPGTSVGSSRLGGDSRVG
ncbi:MAG: hypothetical protein GYB33_03455 [Gammaproteobacteria bacterium]|uniref:phage tail protein n=1 Tax=Pseudomaricurvus alcaniphilus TaxID=1166482 RepID=UPI00140B9258|nr:phage tail protein [Pseudomaricurvus alcaniphilus]MBR9909395.1 hypothetical protein [Gammaproteobacteria bacterium]NHN38332.1 hypothetical protein [Pseudomaricurvus alcaniphilus]